MSARAEARIHPRSAHTTAARVWRILRYIIMYGFLVLAAILLLLPFVWMFSTSLKELGDVFLYPPVLVPTPMHWENYWTSMTKYPFDIFFRNTLTVVVFAVSGQIISSSLAGFAFARLRGRGRDLLFGLVLATMMVPEQVTLIPTFIIFKSLGWIDTLLPLTVPYWFGGAALYTFLFRQFYRTIPMDLDEAAKIDGCGYLGIYWRIIVPLSLPAVASACIFSFLARWNDFMHPLIYLHNRANFTVALGLRLFQEMQQGGMALGVLVEWNLLMAASLITMLPPLAIFAVAQRYFVRGVVTTGIKG